MIVWKLQTCVLLAAVLLSACATSPIAPLGSSSYAPAREGDEQEIWTQGERLAQELERQGLIYNNPALIAYVNQVGQKVVPPAAQVQMPFRFFILRDSRPNAFALGSGQIYIHMGLLSSLESEDQLAMILAHEATHVVNRHLLQHVRSLKTKTVAAKIVSTVVTPPAVYFGGGLLANLFNLGLSLTYAAAVSGYSRELEEEADREGMRQVVRAGYNVQEVPRIFDLMLAEQEDPGAVKTFFYSSHPANRERSRYTQELLRTEFASLPATAEGTNAEEFRKQSQRLRLDTAILDIHSERYQHAVTGLHRVLEQAPGSSEVYYYLGEAHRLGASHPERRAVEEAERQRREPKSGEQVLSEADIQRELRLAAEAYTQALQYDPQYADPHRGLGFLYRQQGLRDLARGELETYLQFKPEAEDRRVINRHLAELSH